MGGSGLISCQVEGAQSRRGTNGTLIHAVQGIIGQNRRLDAGYILQGLECTGPDASPWARARKGGCSGRQAKFGICRFKTDRNRKGRSGRDTTDSKWMFGVRVD